MTNEQNIQTKKWNKISVIVFCVTLFNITFEILTFFYIKDATFFISVFAAVPLIFISIIATTRTKRLNQRGIYLDIASIVLNLISVGFFLFILMAVGTVLDMG